MTDVLDQWHAPVWNERYRRMSARLVPRLTEMATEVGKTAVDQGLSLADLVLAAGLPADQVVAIGKRTIRGTNWLKRL